MILATDPSRSILALDDPGPLPAPLGRCRYRAFGARTDIAGIAPARQDPSFQNRTFDAGLGIYDYRNRSFDPATGRFLQRDPVMGGDPLYNPYCFPGNNPVVATDAMGMGVGHHYIPQALWDELPDLPLEVRAYLKAATSGPLRGGHGWSTGHRIYNDAVRKMWDDTLREAGGVKNLKVSDAESLLKKVLRSQKEEIAPFLKRVNSKMILRSKDVAGQALRAARRIKPAAVAAEGLAGRGAALSAAKGPLDGLRSAGVDAADDLIDDAAAGLSKARRAMRGLKGALGGTAAKVGGLALGFMLEVVFAEAAEAAEIQTPSGLEWNQTGKLFRPCPAARGEERLVVVFKIYKATIGAIPVTQPDWYDFGGVPVWPTTKSDVHNVYREEIEEVTCMIGSREELQRALEEIHGALPKTVHVPAPNGSPLREEYRVGVHVIDPDSPLVKAGSGSAFAQSVADDPPVWREGE